VNILVSFLQPYPRKGFAERFILIWLSINIGILRNNQDSIAAKAIIKKGMDPMLNRLTGNLQGVT